MTRVVERKAACPYGLGCPRIDGKNCDSCELADKDRAIYVEDLYDDNVALRAENERLRSDLALADADVETLQRMNDLLRAMVETAAAMVRNADPDLADALLRQAPGQKESLQ